MSAERKGNKFIFKGISLDYTGKPSVYYQAHNPKKKTMKNFSSINDARKWLGWVK